MILLSYQDALSVAGVNAVEPVSEAALPVHPTLMSEPVMTLITPSTDARMPIAESTCSMELLAHNNTAVTPHEKRMETSVTHEVNIFAPNMF
jgi:hypothetical protein